MFAAPFDRRRFLRHTAWLGTAAGVVTLGGACSRKVPPRPPGVTALSAEQADTVRSVIAALLPGDSTFPAGLDLGLLPKIDRAVARYPEPLRARILDALLFLEWEPAISWSLRPFSERPAPERAAVFAGFAASRWALKRAVHVAIKGIVLFAYADEPRVWPGMGYDGPWIKIAGAGAQP